MYAVNPLSVELCSSATMQWSRWNHCPDSSFACFRLASAGLPTLPLLCLDGDGDVGGGVVGQWGARSCTRNGDEQDMFVSGQLAVLRLCGAHQKVQRR